MNNPNTMETLNTSQRKKRTKIKIKRTQKTINMSNADPLKNTGVKPGAQEGKSVPN